MSKEELPNKDKLHQEIADKIGVALHYNEIIELKYFKILWGNKFYKNIIGQSLEKRNKNTKDFHHNSYSKKGFSDIAATLNTSLYENNSYSVLYKSLNKWLITLGRPHKRNANNELTHLLCSTADLSANKHILELFIDLQKDIAKLKKQLTLSKLSKTEKIILEFIGHGKSEKEISSTLNRSPHTIKNHLRNIRSKLSLTKNTELVKFAIEAGIV